MTQARFWKPNPQAMDALKVRSSADPDTDTWLTPRFVLSELGKFDLDPCCAASNPNWTGAKYCWTEREDGLSRPWKGRVFMNPPFSNTAEWLERHAAHGNGISLVPATVEAIMWRNFVWKLAKAVLLTHGRMRFCRPDGSVTTGRPRQGIALIAWSAADRRVLADCAIAGTLVTEWEQR